MKLAPKFGVSVSYVTSIGYAAPNYTAQCLAAKQAGVTVLSVADATQVLERVAQSCDAQGYDPVMLGGDGSVAKQFVSLPLLKDKLLGYEPDVPFFVNNTPGTKAMLKAFRTYEPAMLASADYGETAVQSWVSGLLLDAAAKAGHLGVSGAPTSQELLTGLYSLHNETLGGMVPPLTYKKGAVTAIDCWYWIATKNGKFVMPFGTKPVCRSSAP